MENGILNHNTHSKANTLSLYIVSTLLLTLKEKEMEIIMQQQGVETKTIHQIKKNGLSTGKWRVLIQGQKLGVAQFMHEGWEFKAKLVPRKSKAAEREWDYTPEQVWAKKYPSNTVSSSGAPPPNANQILEAKPSQPPVIQLSQPAVAVVRGHSQPPQTPAGFSIDQKGKGKPKPQMVSTNTEENSTGQRPLMQEDTTPKKMVAYNESAQLCTPFTTPSGKTVYINKRGKELTENMVLLVAEGTPKSEIHVRWREREKRERNQTPNTEEIKRDKEIKKVKNQPESTRRWRDPLVESEESAPPESVDSLKSPWQSPGQSEAEYPSDRSDSDEEGIIPPALIFPGAECTKCKMEVERGAIRIRRGDRQWHMECAECPRCKIHLGFSKKTEPNRYKCKCGNKVRLIKNVKVEYRGVQYDLEEQDV